jgi:hypothetical protein
VPSHWVSSIQFLTAIWIKRDLGKLNKVDQKVHHGKKLVFALGDGVFAGQDSCA